jgi:hypothetical protein
MLPYFKSSKMIVKTSDDHYLVGKNLNQFHLLGGKKEKLESSFDNLKREVLEESSYVIDLKKLDSNTYFFSIFDKIIHLSLDNLVFDKNYKCFFYIFSTNDITDNIFKDIKKLMIINRHLIITKIINEINLTQYFLAAYYLIEKYVITRKKSFLNSLINLYNYYNISWKNEYYQRINDYSVFLEMETLEIVSIDQLKSNLREKNILPFL